MNIKAMSKDRFMSTFVVYPSNNAVYPTVL